MGSSSLSGQCHDRGFLVATEAITTKGQGHDRSLVKAKRFQVAIENCSVAIIFHRVVSRQGILCRDRVWPRPKDLRCNRVGQGRKKLCYDRAFYVAIKFCPRPKVIFSRQNIFLCRDRDCPRQELLSHDRLKSSMLHHTFYVATGVGCCSKAHYRNKEFNVATKLGHGRRFPCRDLIF